ncbi:MAG: hypothetical protein IT462_06175 [Planctomycetes bacterium]|nr:hypothetical protein [Planctomycetota bacterium]
MPTKIAYVLPVMKLSRKQRRLGNKMFGLARACVNWLHYGWRAVSNAKFLRLAAASLAFAGTLAATTPPANAASGDATPVAGSFRVNQTINNRQQDPAVAMDADGDYVVVWKDYYNSAFGLPELKLRRYNRLGAPKGPEELVIDLPVGGSDQVDVAMDAEGNFVVVFELFTEAVYAQRYDAAGSRNGRPIRIDQREASNQSYGPAVAMDADGDFVVVWESSRIELSVSSYYSPGFFNGIAARVFDNAGNPKTDEFLVNSTVLLTQEAPEVAMDAEGNFVVVWHGEYNNPDFYAVFGQRFDSDGQRVGLEFMVNEDDVDVQDEPDVAMDHDGSFVVVWQHKYYGSFNDFSVKMRRYNEAGQPVDGEQFVAMGDGSDNSLAFFNPSVGLDADGDFVVAFERYERYYYSSFLSFSRESIRAQAFFANGTADGSEFVVNQLNFNQLEPVIAVDADGDFVVVREGDGPGDSFSGGVFGRLYVVTTDTAAPMVGGVYTTGADERLYQDERLAHRPTQLVVTFSEDMNASTVENTANWVLTRNGMDVTSWIDSVSFGWNAATSRYEALVEFGAELKDGSYKLEVLGSIADAANNAMGGDYCIDFSVWKTVALGTDRITDDNGMNPAIQGGSGPASGAVGNAAVAMDADGNYAIVWVDTYYGSDYVGNTGYPFYFPVFDYWTNSDIFLRRYNADGTAATDPINVTDTGGRLGWSEVNPKVAMDDDGNVVVVYVRFYDEYNNYDSSANQHVIARRFDANDDEVGSEITTSAFSGPQRHPALAMDKDGDFVVAWSSRQFNGDQEVFAKGWHWDGSVFPAPSFNQIVSSNNYYDDWPSVDMDDDGDFVVTWIGDRWHSFPYYTWNTDVFARRYNFDGYFRGQVDIATDPSKAEWSPAVALDHDGDFVVAWTTFIVESYSYGPFSTYSEYVDHIFVRSFNAHGEPRTDAQQVSQRQEEDQDSWSTDHMNPSVAMDSDGEFVVSWSFNDDYFISRYQSGPYSYNSYSISGGVLARRFDAGATAIGPQFLVQSTLDGLSYGSVNPGIAMDSDGDFVVVWTGFAEQRDYAVSSSGYYIDVDYDYDYGVIHRRFGRNEAPIAVNDFNWFATEDDSADWVDLDGLFHDSTDSLEMLSFSITSNDNPDLVTATIDDNMSDDPDVKLEYTPDANGVAHIVVRATDQDGLWVERTITLTVDPLNDAPVLDDSGSPVLTDVLEDSTNPAGNTVASIIGSSITDVDGDTVGIAIFAADNADGQWQYNVGAGWVNFPAVDTDNALVLGPSNSVRFIPDPAFTGSSTFDYRGWDQSDSAAAGSTVDIDTAGTGGTTPFSDDTETATVNVNNSNDAPTLTGPGSLSDIDEDETDPAGDDVAGIVGATINDVDPGALEGIAVIGADSSNGMWEYSTNAGASWSALPDVATDDALLLSPADMLRFIPNADFEGTATVTYRAWDQTSGGAGDMADTTVNGGSTAFSTATENGTVTVNNVNDAPILDNGGNPLIGTITNTDADPAGVEISTLVGSTISDIDAGAVEGVAIVNIAGATAGVWQYSTDAGASWNDFPAVSQSSALLLAEDDMVRYIAGAGFVGTATVSFHAWDQTTGSSGGTADLSGASSTGGTTAFSVDFETARVIVVAGSTGGGGGDDDGGCVANTGTQGAAFGLLAVLMAMFASLRGLMRRRSE